MRTCVNIFNKGRKMKKNELLKFIGKIIFYFVVIVCLLYLYSYSHTGGAHFIYDEF